MSKRKWLAVAGLAGLACLAAMAPDARAQVSSYIGFVYPAGGQQGTTVRIRLGGQRLDDVNQVLVSGPGVQAKVVENLRNRNNQEMSLLREQLRNLRRGGRRAPLKDEATEKMAARIEKIMAEYVNRPACVSIASIVLADVTIAPDAEPGEREIRLATLRGVSNPLPFYVGQVPEVARKPMLTSSFQVLGKEELALRTRPAEEVEQRITVPCTANGQIASGEVNHYRFEARKGQRLVLSTQARQLVPFIADAVPGWFQPVLALYGPDGKEVAYDDDFRFMPDPVIYYEVPEDGEYVFTITDAIYRGREDFVYRVTVGELPFVTSIFPLGGRVGETPKIEMKGWNLEGARLTPPPPDAGPGIHRIAACRDKLCSNPVLFALDALPERFEQESNNDPSHAQKVELPAIVNGRMDAPGDSDVFQINGRAGDKIVAEVMARRLGSPVDSVVKITDAGGKLLALNDDHYDVGSGMNTHHADSYCTAELPADGTYYVHLGDTARGGGEAYAYRLRISAPQPDFELYVVPSGAALRSKGNGAATVYAVRKDGFSGPIKLGLKDPPKGFSATPVTLLPTQVVARLSVKTDLVSTPRPVTLAVEGRALAGDREIVRQALPGEDRMQAFLWRHHLPAEELKLLVFDPSYEPPPKRAAPTLPPPKPKEKPAGEPSAKPQFTKRQVEGRLRQLRNLYEEGLLTDEFYAEKVAECEAAL